MIVQAREKITNLEVEGARWTKVEEDNKHAVESVRLLEEDLKVSQQSVLRWKEKYIEAQANTVKLQEQLEIEQNLAKKKSKL